MGVEPIQVRCRCKGRSRTAYLTAWKLSRRGLYSLDLYLLYHFVIGLSTTFFYFFGGISIPLSSKCFASATLYVFLRIKNVKALGTPLGF